MKKFKNVLKFVLYGVRENLKYKIRTYSVQDFFVIHIAMINSMFYDAQKLL